jgi:hypothetical protein
MKQLIMKEKVKKNGKLMIWRFDEFGKLVQWLVAKRQVDEMVS